MKCLSCDRMLNDFESTRKGASGMYIDLCNYCFKEVHRDFDGVDERYDLHHADDEVQEYEDTPLEEFIDEHIDSDMIVW